MVKERKDILAREIWGKGSGPGLIWKLRPRAIEQIERIRTNPNMVSFDTVWNERKSVRS